MGRSLAKLFVLLIVDCTPQRLWRGCLALPLWMNASHLIWCQNLSAAGPGCWLDGRDSDPVDRVWDSFRDHMSYMLLMQKFHGGENHLLLKFPRSPRSQIGRLKVWTWHWDVHCNWGLISQINLVHERGKRKEWKNDPQREGDIWSGIWKIRRYFLAKGARRERSVRTECKRQKSRNGEERLELQGPPAAYHSVLAQSSLPWRLASQMQDLGSASSVLQGSLGPSWCHERSFQGREI